MAVTAHAFAGKSRWVAEKQAEGIWAGVRVYDADDLAQSLEQAPAVARWFANLQEIAPLRRVTLLWDEVESHLHPRWQRAVLPALLEFSLESDRRGKVVRVTPERWERLDDVNTWLSTGTR